MTQALNLANFANNLNTSGQTANGGLQNSSVTVSAGTGMSGGGAVALGSSVTLTNAGVTSLTAGSGISVSGSTGGVTISATGGVSGLFGQAFASSGTFTVPTGVTSLQVTVVGGGGGGGGAQSTGGTSPTAGTSGTGSSFGSYVTCGGGGGGGTAVRINTSGVTYGTSGSNGSVSTSFSQFANGQYPKSSTNGQYRGIGGNGAQAFTGVCCGSPSQSIAGNGGFGGEATCFITGLTGGSTVTITVGTNGNAGTTGAGSISSTTAGTTGSVTIIW